MGVVSGLVNDRWDFGATSATYKRGTNEKLTKSAAPVATVPWPKPWSPRPFQERFGEVARSIREAMLPLIVDKIRSIWIFAITDSLEYWRSGLSGPHHSNTPALHCHSYRRQLTSEPMPR